MTTRLILSRGAVCRALLVAFVVSLLPLPALAGEKTDTSKPGNLQAAMTKVVERDLAKEPPRADRLARSRARAQETTQAKESPAFFKTRTGVIVLGALAAGTVYAIYSTQNDRINSPGKQ